MPRYALANKWRNESKIRVHSDGIILSRFHFFFIFSLIDFDIVSFLQSVVTLSWNEKTMDSAFFRLFIPVSFNFLGILFCFYISMKWRVLLANFIDDQNGAFRLIQKDQNQVKHFELEEGGHIEGNKWFSILNWPTFHSLVPTSFCIELQNSISRWCSSLLLSIDCVRSNVSPANLFVLLFIRYYLPINQWINRREHYLLSFNH